MWHIYIYKHLYFTYEYICIICINIYFTCEHICVCTHMYTYMSKIYFKEVDELCIYFSKIKGTIS